MFENEILDLFFNSLPDALLICLNDGTVIRGNLQAGKILGYTPAEIEGKSIEIFLPDHLKETHKNFREEYLKDPRPRGMGERDILKVRRKDKTEIPVSISLNTMTISGTDMIVVCIRDNSIYFDARLKEKNIEEKRQQAQKLESLGVMSAGIAHDFNNFLQIILGNTELAASQLTGESPLLSSINDIKAAAFQLSELTQQILAFSGGREVEEKNINISLLVEEMMRLLQVSISENINVEYNLLKEPPNVVGDSSQLRQIILNFIMNASEAIGEEDGIINVSTGKVDFDEASPYRLYRGNKKLTGEYIFIEVCDNGIGMEESTRRKLFDPFFSTKSNGRGLGLSVVHGIVDAHEGALEVHSELGQGSAFKVFLPCSKVHSELLFDSSSDKDPHASHSKVVQKEIHFH